MPKKNYVTEDARQSEACLKMPTPAGDMPIRREIIDKHAAMTDREIADKALKSGPFIDPEAYAELLHRGLSGPGIKTEDTYALIAHRETLAAGDDQPLSTEAAPVRRRMK